MLSLYLLSGLLFANGIPHFVNGISGKMFHSPFASPPIKSLSSAVTNVIWGMSNFTISLVILSSVDGLIIGFNLPFALFTADFARTSIGLSSIFAKLDS